MSTTSDKMRTDTLMTLKAYLEEGCPQNRREEMRDLAIEALAGPAEMTIPLTTHFRKYGSDTMGDSFTLAELIESAFKLELWAHAEDSGCESCYCEVAIWVESRRRWERYAFVKCYDVERGIDCEASDEDVAHEMARMINAKTWVKDRAPLVHIMPNYEGEPNGPVQGN